MAERRNLTLEAVISAAVQVVEENGLDRLNLNVIAARLNVKTPSLYNHVKGLEDMRRELCSLVLMQIEAAVKNAAVGRSAEDALREIARAYRSFSIEHPELYRAIIGAPIENSEYLEKLVGTYHRVLSVFGLTENEKAHFIRIFHSGLHGFVSLENTGFFNIGPDIEQSFELMIDNYIKLLIK